ncbi:MAG: fibronectin type III domain-containing protein, partial [Actinomycetes bacterium]
AAGTGSYSAQSSPGVAPRSVPEAPTLIVGTVGNAQVALTWTALANNGDAISDYTIQSCLGVTCTAFAHTPSADTSITVNNLINGSAYTFQIAAKNAAGTSVAAVSSSYIPRTVPTAPLSVLGTVGSQQVALSWTVPSSNGGNAISDYTVQSCTGGDCTTFNDGTSTGTSATVTGLTNGTAYTFRVSAKNAAGDSPYSIASLLITPRTIPDAPTGVTATADNTGGIDVSWTAPTNNGGAAITDYTLQSCLVDCTTVTRVASTATSVKVSGLIKGTAYTFQVAAVNAAGTGLYSAKSAAATPRAVAATPTGLTGTVGDRQVALTWIAPANNGAAIINYVVQSCVGSSCSTFVHSESAATAMTVTGLVNGTAYTFTVAAINIAGTGGAVTSAAYTPRTVPDAPTGVRAVADNTAGADISWTAPEFNGGSAITDYVVEYKSGTEDYVAFTHSASPNTSLKVTGLTKGAVYTFRVAAKNIAGQGAYSAISDYPIVVPRSVPGRPTVIASPTADGAIQLQWNFAFGETDGGLSDDGDIRYEVEYALKDSLIYTKMKPINIANTRVERESENLEIGKQYKFRAIASNEAGTGLPSQDVFATPVIRPQSVTNLSYKLTSSGLGRTLALSWNAPIDTGGALMKKYNIGYWSSTFTDKNGLPITTGKSRGTVFTTSSGLATTYSFPISAGTWTFYVQSENTVGTEACLTADVFRCGTSITVDVAE